MVTEDCVVMICYSDGKEARVGEKILCDCGLRTGIVESIVEDPELIKALDIGEPSLFVSEEGCGLCQICADTIKIEEIILISRKSDAPSNKSNGS
jgi:hypothetical protein